MSLNNPNHLHNHLMPNQLPGIYQRRMPPPMPYYGRPYRPKRRASSSSEESSSYKKPKKAKKSRKRKDTSSSDDGTSMKTTEKPQKPALPIGAAVDTLEFENRLDEIE